MQCKSSSSSEDDQGHALGTTNLRALNVMCVLSCIWLLFGLGVLNGACNATFLWLVEGA